MKIFHPELSLLHTIYHVTKHFLTLHICNLFYLGRQFEKFQVKRMKSKDNLVAVPSSFPPSPLENGHFLTYFVHIWNGSQSVIHWKILEDILWNLICKYRKHLRFQIRFDPIVLQLAFVHSAEDERNMRKKSETFALCHKQVEHCRKPLLWLTTMTHRHLSF